MVKEFEDDDEAARDADLETAIELVQSMRATLIATATAFNSPYKPDRRAFTRQQRELAGILRRHAIRNLFPWAEVDEGVVASRVDSTRYADIRAFFNERAEKMISELEHRVADQASGDLASATAALVDDTAESADLAAVRDRVRRIEKALPIDPISALSEAKNLLEVVAKTVLAELGEAVVSDRDLGKLTNQAAAALGVDRRSAAAQHHQDVAAIMQRLQSLVLALGDLRNHAGNGHGDLDLPEGVGLPHGRLAVRAAITWSAFMLDILHERRREDDESGG